MDTIMYKLTMGIKIIAWSAIKHIKDNMPESSEKICVI